MRDQLTKATISFLGSVALAALAQPGLARTQTGYDLKLEAQPLDSALQSLGRTAGKEIMYSEGAVANRQASALRGHMKLEAALKQLLRGTGLVADIRPDVILIREADKRPRSAIGDQGETDIVVTGSHIRGSEPISPVTVAAREEIERRGFSDLGSYARDLVQNYSGGQNPGVAGSGQGGSNNLTSSSALNLRGLGADATLTLFNGHRVAYDAVGQGVDISAVPLAAVDRVEVVADGSSALYGSDAVGGVANVILRRDFEGAAVSARLGAATDGGDEEQQYNLVTGKRWQTGGFMAAFDYRHVTPITAGQRSYSRNLDGGATMVSGQTQYSAVLAGHQSLTDALTLSVDGHFNDRKTSSCIVYTATANCFGNGADSTTKMRSWSVSPSLDLDMAGGWQVHLGGTISESAADNRTDGYNATGRFQRGRAYYTNRLKTIDLSGEGPLFALPGGDARLALGLGLRDAKLVSNATAVVNGVFRSNFVFTQKRETYYAYGELSLPFVGPDNAVPLVERLTVTGALRYEDTAHIGRLATPKVGLVYAPVRDIALKFSWGKSFKAPTLFQTGQFPAGYLTLASSYVPASPNSQTVLLLTGGNPNLKPERATSWTAGVSLTPNFMDGLKVEASYFSVKYRDRVVQPIPSTLSVFMPQYSEFITLNPSAAQVLAVVNALPLPPVDQGGGPFDANSIGAIVTDFLQNAARQSIEGVDLSVDYRFSLSPRDQIRVNAAASYLKSEQQLSISQPVVQQAGILFRPPHWRARSSVDWQRDNVSLTGTFSFIGGSLDNRIEPYVRVGSYKSVDLIGRVKTADDQGALSDITVTLAVLNILNEKPAYVRNTSPSGYRYDSTNFPSIGRFIGLTVAKTF
ncbi:MAG TPA: TonB-dependent receptor [Sphingobium sp.]|uniref:TonB-dependent receptor n=1 Tax=Sphingobium sp. TaxID=1912891 RepID=UPI002ED27DFD